MENSKWMPSSLYKSERIQKERAGTRGTVSATEGKRKYNMANMETRSPTRENSARHAAGLGARPIVLKRVGDGG